jgi:hypothetical protein
MSLHRNLYFETFALLRGHQGDQNWLIFAHRAIVYIGQFYLKLHTGVAQLLGHFL